MAQNSPVEIVRHASAMVHRVGRFADYLGMVAIGSPFLAAVAVNVVIAWLIVFAGVVHLCWRFTRMGRAA